MVIAEQTSKKKQLHELSPEEIVLLGKRGLETKLLKALYKQSLTIERLEEMLKPHRYSQSGFIQDGEHAVDIIYKDAKTLYELSVTYKQIMGSLNEIVNQVKSTKNGVILIEEKDIKVVDSVANQKWQLREAMKTNPFLEGALEAMGGSFGSQESPFSNEKGVTDYVISRVSNPEESLTVSELHYKELIPIWRFFEGNTDYRVSPKRLVQMLQIN